MRKSQALRGGGRMVRL